MNKFRLIIRSLVFYKRSWLGVLAGTALTAMILTGALLIGNSAKTTLRNIALQRLGKAEFVMAPNNKFFKVDLADRLKETLQRDTAALLTLRGIAISQKDDSRKQVNNIQVLGASKTFWEFTDNFALTDTKVAINERLASALMIQPGDEISIRLEKPSMLARDALLSSRAEDLTERRLFTVTAIVTDNQLGRFSLEASQVTPHNIFLSLSELQNITDLTDKANVLLVKENSEITLTAADTDKALQKIYQPEDLGLRLRAEKELGILQIESENIYIPGIVSNAINGYAVLTYMVNSISSLNNSTPYSFAAAIQPTDNKDYGPVPSDMKDNEILINSWLAKHLSIQKGEQLKLTYFDLLPSNKLTEKTAHFEVYDVVDIKKIKSERLLTPLFPGLTDIDSCADWDVGLPMNEELLKDEANEDYWDEYKETPKAFVTLNKGLKLWGNRFGSLTALRIPLDKKDETRSAIRSTVSPAELGYFFIPAREQALTAVSEAIDLGQLFLGMSFFLIISSLLIIAFLFGLTVQERSEQCGLLLATGFNPKEIRSLLIGEGSIIAAAGSVIGCIISFYYTQLLLKGISGQWKGAVANSAIQFHFNLASPLTGILTTIIFALLVMHIVLKKQLKVSASRQMRGDIKEKSRSTRYIQIIAVLSLIGALAIVGKGISSELSHAAHSFFGAGSLLLLSSLLFARIAIDKPHQTTRPFQVSSLIINNIKRKQNNSLGIIALLACGCFMVFSVSSMKENLTLDASERHSGTGGFDFFAESTIPILSDLNTAKGREEYRLQNIDIKNIINIKVQEGDDSSCFNLNHAISPPLLGVDQDILSELRAFETEGSNDSIWKLLETPLPDNVIPAIVGDSDTLMWGLKKKADIKEGAILDYKDEQGRDLKIKLVASLPMRLSVFQGNLLISKENFTKHFPSESGHRMFLIDTEQNIETQDQLTKKLERFGFEATPAQERLQAFYAIESAYLSIFLVLGGFGLILGAAGMGTIAWRNIAERRTEIEILRATGFSRNKIRQILSAEYLLLLFAGLVCGSFSAMLAISPNLFVPGVEVPWLQLLNIAIAIAITGSLFVILAIILATGKKRSFSCNPRD